MKPLTPHGSGFSFLDSCEILKVREEALGKKYLDPDASYFKDHFPGNPLMPGVLLIESAAQASGYLWSHDRVGDDDKVYLVQVDGYRLIKPVKPGGVIFIEIRLEKDFDSLAIFDTVIKMEGDAVARGRITLGRGKLSTTK